MQNSLRYFAAFAFATLALLIVTPGCSGIGEAIDCEQLCSELHSCVNSDLNVHRCSERCEDKAENDALSDKLDACTDCLDHDVACSEISTRCSMCQEVSDLILE